jgi:RNA polymerase sigma-70 factor (ECF subfamily)
MENRVYTVSPAGKYPTIAAAQEEARKCGGTVLLDELSECLPDTDAPDPTDDLTLRDSLESFLMALPAEDRALMLRRYYNGDPIEEIARDVGLRAGTVRVRLHRLRERLREHLESNGISL